VVVATLAEIPTATTPTEATPALACLAFVHAEFAEGGKSLPDGLTRLLVTQRCHSGVHGPIHRPRPRPVSVSFSPSSPTLRA